MTEIQSYARKEFDKLWDEYKRVLNPQHYPVDLARDIWQDKMDLIDKMRKKPLVKEKNEFARDHYQQLGVKPVIDAQEEIRRSIDFLKRYLKKTTSLKPLY